MARIAANVDLTLTLGPSKQPLRHRISDAIIAEIKAGRLRPGDPLPPSRSLAATLGVARGPVVEAYDELAAAGFTEAVPGARTVIAPGADIAAAGGFTSHITKIDPTPNPITRAERPATWNMTPGLPDVTLISTDDWRRAWRTASAQVPSVVASVRKNHAALRRELSNYLRRARGIIADPSEIFIVPGSLSALRTIVVAAGLKDRVVAFEEPGYSIARNAVLDAGASILPVAVDNDGIDVSALGNTARAVYVTPAHQFPLGTRMSVPRRADLIEWAQRTDGLIIEDDYDGEFRYDVPPLPALRGANGGRDTVAYIGTTSKVLSPSLRLAWLIPPPEFIDGVARALGRSEEAVGTVSSDAMAHFIGSGALTKHIAKASRTYRARRHALMSELKRQLPEAELLGIDGGLHFQLHLDDHADVVGIVRDAAQQGIALENIDWYHATPARSHSVLCGFALLPESQAQQVAAVIASVVRAHSLR